MKRKSISTILTFALVLCMAAAMLPGTAMAATAVGDVVQFGGYDWRVLDVQDGKALILSDKIIDRMPYDDFSSDGTDWETSSLRAYLNDSFYNSLSESDKELILETTVINNDNPWFNVEGNPALGGNDTKDKIFLLSLEEVVQYFGDSGTLANGFGTQHPDPYINDQYNEQRIAYDVNGTACWWWLRSVGTNNLSAARVETQGWIYVNGINMGGGGSDDWVRGVRPAMWITTNGGTTTTPPTQTTPPTANTPSSWAADSVNAAITAGLVPESLQSTYTQATTRAEFCALAVALYENVMGSEITGRTEFDDTDDMNVEKAAAIGVVNGVAPGTFSPDAGLTREQAATMLSRLADAVGKPLAASAPTFADNGSIAQWAADAVGQVQATEIMGGVGNNTFDPKGDYTREQSIITIMRLYDAVG